MIQCVERGGNVIDLKKANEEFDKYVKNYNSEDKKIALKIEHINMKKYKPMQTGYAYIYDFNFNFSYEYVNNKQYLDKIYKRHTFTDNDTMKRYNLIYDTAKKYIKEKTK